MIRIKEMATRETNRSKLRRLNIMETLLEEVLVNNAFTVKRRGTFEMNAWH